MPRSSSATVTVTRASSPTPAAVSATVVVSSSASSSCCAVTVTVCAVFQSDVVNVSVEGDAVAAPWSRLATATVVVAVGALCSTAVNVPSLALVEPAASFSDTFAGDAVASSEVATGTVAVVTSPASACAAASTVTPSVWAESKSAPVWPSVSVAVVLPPVAVTDDTERPGTPVFSRKPAIPTPLTNVLLVSVTVTVAPSSVASVSIAGLVGASVAVGVVSVIVNVSSARSPSAWLASPSWTRTVTVESPSAPLGVPQMVRACWQVPVPSTSQDSPVGRPLTVQL